MNKFSDQTSGVKWHISFSLDKKSSFFEVGLLHALESLLKIVFYGTAVSYIKFSWCCFLQRARLSLWATLKSIAWRSLLKKGTFFSNALHLEFPWFWNFLIFLNFIHDFSFEAKSQLETNIGWVAYCKRYCPNVSITPITAIGCQ